MIFVDYSLEEKLVSFLLLLFVVEFFFESEEKLVSSCYWKVFLFLGLWLKLWIFRLLIMNEIPIAAQQLVVDSIKKISSSLPRVVLCNDAGWLSSDETCQVCTHDKFEDYLLSHSVKLATIFPSIGSIRRTLTNYRDESFCFEAVFACHHAVDPFGIAMEILGKFGTDSKYIKAIHFLVDIPKDVLRKYGTVAYRLIFQSSFIGETKLFWTKPSDPLDEMLFPKHVLDHEGITDILHDNQGSLKCYSQGRNGCFDIEGGQNYKSLSFRPGYRSHDYRQKLHALVQLARRITKEGSTGSVQTKFWTNWKNGKGDVKIEKSLLFCRHLDHLKLGKFANFLTKCDIDFYCAARSTIVIDIEGIDASVLIRLMHYAELPIPTTEAQGAFSLNIRSVGICASDPTLLAFCVSFGRIGSLPSYPVQIKSKELRSLLTSPLKESAIVIWLQQKVSGFNFQLVTCVDEQQHVDEYLQFRISTAIPGSFPNHHTVNGVKFRIDHALPYAMPISSGVRPPTAQSVHEHWKSSVKRTSNDRKGHANAVEKVENCSGSMLRCLRLRELVAQDDHGKYSACFEKGHVPLCFFRKEVPVDVALEFFTYWCRSFSAMEDHKLCALDELSTSSKDSYPSDDCQRLCIATVHCLSEQSLKVGFFFKGKYGWTVSTSERLQCYAYTACTIILVLPGGYRIEDICSPAEHISVQKVFSLDDKQLFKSGDDELGVGSGPATATPLGCNPLHLQGSTQASDGAKSQKSGASKVIGTEVETSPTLPWPRHDLQSCQVEGQQVSHLSDRIYRPPEAETDETKPVAADRRSYNNGRGLDNDTDKDIKGLLPDNQPDSKSSQLGEVKPHVEGQVSSAPNFDQGSQLALAQFNNQSALYVGEKPMPKLVAAESCVGEGILDPRSNDNLEGQGCYPDMQVAAQNVLPPGAVSRSPPPRERKSRSMSVSKRGCTNKTRPASFARSVSPTISKIQAGQTKDQIKSLLQTTPHKQRSNISRNKNHGLLSQVDVSKPVITPVPPDVDMSPRKPKDHQVDADIVDLVTKLSKEEKERETLMKTEINDAVHKWCATYPAAHQIRVAHVALKFRCRISSTICFLVAAYRLLAKAPWTTNMIAVDIKQAAFYAISKGWSLKDPTAGDFPFSVAELAVAAATYLEQIPPVMLGFLPPVCSKLFSTVTLTCAHCLATCTAPCPFFNTHVTWTMTEWVDLATALTEATMHPWVQSQGWHAEGCNMSQHLIDLKNMTSWVLLQLQPEHHDKYPFVCDSMNLAKDQSLLRISATITAFLCSNSRGQQDRHRHYWVVEFENGLPKYVFDSLQGKQRLTTELAKKLRVFGVLFNVGNEHVPFLRTRYLDEAAGIVPAIHRGRNPIIVLGRGRIQWARNALCKKYKTPTPKKGRVQKHMLKGSKQNRPSGNPSGARSTKGPAAEKKNGGSHKPTKPIKSGKRQTNSTRKTLPWLFSQTSGAPPSPRHRADDIGQILEISDDSESENHLEAEPSELRNDLPLSDPISQFPPSRETSGGGDGHAANGSPVEGKRFATVPRERSRSPLSTRSKPPKQSPFPQCGDNKKKDSTLAAQEVGPDANTENAVALVEREVGPACDIKGPGSSAREVGPAASFGEAVGLTKQAVGPIVSPGDACAGNNGIIEQDYQQNIKPGKYGIISLFDGVSPVVRILTKKLGCPPTAILLAENDESLRRLVCTEFGYRSDEKWGYTMSGSACLYISDVHKLAENDCLLLRQLTAQFPGLKWFIIGGSPCQDLTYAGYLHGLLGLVGARSRLFFLLLLTIRTIQILVGTSSVRFLVENAGSMKDVHFVAFCKLLGLPFEEPFDQYTWDLAKFTCFITRKRNFFRNMVDFEPITDLDSWHSEDSGPLLTIGGKTVAFAPLLRTRKTMNYGICHSSWTLYQPHALVWDYSFWGGKEAFRHFCNIQTGHRPALAWERFVPPPFLDDWRIFIEALQRGGCTSANFDKIILPLLPMFECCTYKLPFRILTAKEVLKLSGLENHWTNIDSEDANRLPDPLIRDMCGNSFHPALISSAFGNDDVLKRWIQGDEEGSSTLVADQKLVHAIYAELAQLIKQKGQELHKNIDIPVVEELPCYPCVEKVKGPVSLPDIAQPVLQGKLDVELNKTDQRIESGIDATVAHINEDACLTLERASLATYFDAFRAPVTAGFEADTLLRILWGESQLQKAQTSFRENSPQCPVTANIDQIRMTITNWFLRGSHSLFLLSLLQSIDATTNTKWPVGYFLLVCSGRSSHVFYIGNPNPKLLILIDYRQPRKPLLTLLGATAYSEALSIGCAPTILPTSRLLERHNHEDFLFVESAGGCWSLHCGPYQCTSSSCVCCLLSTLGEIRDCPWHCTMAQDTQHHYTVAHLIGVDCGNGKANVIGYIGSLPLHTHLILIHIIPETKLGECGAWMGYLGASFFVYYHLSGGAVPPSTLESLSSPFRNAQLPLWLFQHFLVRTAGPKVLLDSWLLPRSLLD